MARPIVVVDYHKGNLRSVERGLVEAGGSALVTDDPAIIAESSALVLPGVGSFGDAMAYLCESGQREAVLAALGRATRLESSRLKVPHVGWDQLDLTPLGRACPLFEGVAEGAHVYFTHSYALAGDVPAELVTARTHYARSFASAAWDGANTYGVQFHPEKSSAVGLQILRNFVRLAGSAGVGCAN